MHALLPLIYRNLLLIYPCIMGSPREPCQCQSAPRLKRIIILAGCDSDVLESPLVVSGHKKTNLKTLRHCQVKY